MAAPLPICPQLGPTGFPASEWQRWFDLLRQRSNSSLQSGTAISVTSVTSSGALIAGSVQALGGFGCNGKTIQAAVVLPANATDLPTAITLVNALKAALIANGIGA